MKRPGLTLRLLSIMVPMMFAVAALVFIPAWTLDYWQGWLFLASFFMPMICVMFYMLKYERKLLEKRINVKEKREPQAWIQTVNTLLFLAAMIIAGLDHRFRWSNLPVQWVIGSDVLMLTGYYMFIRTMLYNEYASRTIEIQKGQKLISTGPYAVVRHPMYTAGIFFYLFIPLVLGSAWALIPVALFPLTLALRIIDEEKALIKGLKGYKQYMKKVRYRLIPRVW